MTTRPQKRLKILLLGDACIDVYQYGTVSRLSPEAPVPIFEVKHKYQAAGMADNVKYNLENLGCDVTTLVGTGPLSVKTRYIDIHSHQHIIRIDNDQHHQPLTPLHLPTDWQSKFDGIVVSDYDKGSITIELVEYIRSHCNLPIFIDTKIADLKRLEGCVVKINEVESKKITSRPSSLIVTLGARGASYQDQIFPAPSIQVVDVCGAGDTFLAALAYETLITNKVSLGIKFAIKASSVTVQHRGVYAPSLEEIL